MAETVLLAALLLALAVLVSGVLRRLPVPDSVALVVVGMLAAEAGRHWPALAHLGELQLSPELVFFVLLPALVFESGLNLDARGLVRDLAPIVILAVPALVLSTAVVGTGLWLGFDVEILLALVFGALISATDPVAVVALFREVGAPPRLALLVEGESLFNDATAIVVFGLLVSMLMAGESLGGGALLGALPSFAVVFLGGAALGVAAGAIASELGRRLDCPAPALVALSVSCAYASFVIAEHIAHVSGVMAVVGAAITFGALGVTRITRDVQQVLGETWELIAYVCNALLFLLIGLAVDVSSLLSQWPLILGAVALVHLARAGSVYGLVPVVTRMLGLHRVERSEQHIMWWGGLKGGLAIAMVLSLPQSLEARQLLLDVTVGVVLFTLLVNATTLRTLMSRLGLGRLTTDERAELDQALADARSRVERYLDGFRQAGVLSSGAHHRLVAALLRALAPGRSPVEVPPARAAHLAALRAESDALADLYEDGVIDQYTFLEFRELLLRDHEADRGGAESDTGSLYPRIEAGLLRWLRERDWASPLLARYQSFRLREHLRRNLGGTVLSEAGLASLERRADRDHPDVAALRRVYRGRSRRRRERLAEMSREFPERYAHFQEFTLRRAALNGALQAVEHERGQGQLGAKAGAAMVALLHEALDAVPSKGDEAPPDPADLMARAPVFAGLSAAALEALGAEARPVTFLPGDTIIGQGEHGDALYVISSGEVSVSQSDAGGARKELARLGAGEIFGEAALLGDSLRNATVEAVRSSTMLRITRAEALGVAGRWPEVEERLQQVDAGRH